MTPVWVLMHINNLPMGSATKAEMRGGQEFRGWDEDRYMTASLINGEKISQYLFTLAHSDPDKRKPDPPEMYPLPDKAVRTKSASKPGSFAFIAKARIAAARKKKQEGR